uniref:Uncharacterized protein n=1 Tax=viral metagenome TaxID=1070528 RepID=A0A6M3L3K1_9ZZZZ
MKNFTISAKLDIEVTHDIKAENYEDAIEQAHKMSAADFVEIPHNCWMDGNIEKITFISEQD